MENYQASTTVHVQPEYDPAAAPSAPSIDAFDVNPNVVILLFASLIELIAASKNCNDGSCEHQDAFAVALGCVSLAGLIFYLLAARFLPSVVAAANSIFSMFLLLWWTAGTGVVTFKGPFTLATNGYFASWIAFIAAVAFAYETVPQIKQVIQWIQLRAASSGPAAQLLLIIFIASAVEMIASSVVLDEDNSYKKNQKAWGVAAGVVSMVFTAVFLVVPTLMAYLKWASLFLTVWWLAALGVLTFDAPYLVAGNGYFSCWIAFCVCVYLQYALLAFGQSA